MGPVHAIALTPSRFAATGTLPATSAGRVPVNDLDDPGRSRPTAGAVLLAAVLAVGGCSTDPSTVHRESAVASLEATLGEARAAEVAVRLWVRGRSTQPLAAAVVGESDIGVGSEVSWFEQRRPASHAGQVTHQRTVRALGGAACAVRAVRSALDRSDRKGTRAALVELRTACAVVQRLAVALG